MEKTIKVRTQADWDAIDPKFGGVIAIRNTKSSWLDLKESKGSRVAAYKGSRVIVCECNHVDAWNGSRIVAWEGSHVDAYKGSLVAACDGSHVDAYEGSYVIVEEGSYVSIHEGSHVMEMRILK